MESDRVITAVFFLSFTTLRAPMRQITLPFSPVCSGCFADCILPAYLLASTGETAAASFAGFLPANKMVRAKSVTVSKNTDG